MIVNIQQQVHVHMALWHRDQSPHILFQVNEENKEPTKTHGHADDNSIKNEFWA